jgi:phage terminase large subunit-like protein
MLTIEQKREALALAEERARRERQRRLFSYRPYPKQLEFHAAGKSHRERLLMAGNQQGKTWSKGFENAMHLTGRYPGPGEVFYPTEQELDRLSLTDPRQAAALYENLSQNGLLGADVYPEGWPGYRFTKPIWMWASSVTGDATRDNPQRILVGPPSQKDQWGEGAIPRDDLLVREGRMAYKMAQGTSDALEYILVRHVSGGNSILQFKSYSQGREKWQGPTIDLIWFDEEPPLDIYMEGLTRTNVRQGPVGVTFTPLQGMSGVVQLFIGDGEEGTIEDQGANV